MDKQIHKTSLIFLILKPAGLRTFQSTQELSWQLFSVGKQLYRRHE